MEATGIKLTWAGILGWLMAWVADVWVCVLFVLIAILFDYTTGLLAGRANEGLNSKRAMKGLYKKIGLFMLLCLGLFLDAAINHFMVDKAGILEMPFDLPIAYITTAWIIITEAISVCENLIRLDVPIPKWLLKTLRKAEKQIDKDDEKVGGTNEPN